MASGGMGRGGMRLMVVDDAEPARTAVARYFLARGYEVTVAPDAVGALARTLTHGVDVVIMKAALPGLAGTEAAAILRRISPRVQVILTMGPEAETPPAESQRVERFRCFPLPLDLEALALAIEGAAGRPEAEAGRADG